LFFFAHLAIFYFQEQVFKPALSFCRKGLDMSKGLWLGMALIIGAGGATAQLKPSTDHEKTSYAIGVDIGRSFKMQGAAVNADMLAQGIKDAMAGSGLAMSDSACESHIMKFQEALASHQAEQAAMASSENRKIGEAFLAENKKKPGVVALPSGLQYKVIKEGTGKRPKATDTVTVHYKGTLLNGETFDSSFGRGEPATFPLNRVIKGWTEGLQLMHAGSKYEFYIPSDLAYGDRQMGATITPGSLLVFEVELLEVK
jgi:FKBP-type peptidyl-prolyl cis-trans isomerase FklB